jgi:hypothetical protein
VLPHGLSADAVAEIAKEPENKRKMIAIARHGAFFISDREFCECQPPLSLTYQRLLLAMC